MSVEIEKLKKQVEALKDGLEARERELLAKIDRLQEALHLAETYMGNVTEEYVVRRDELIRRD